MAEEVEVWKPKTFSRFTRHPLDNPDNLKRYLEETYDSLEDDGTLALAGPGWNAPMRYFKPEELIWLREYPENTEFEHSEHKVVTKHDFAKSYEPAGKEEGTA